MSEQVTRTEPDPGRVRSRRRAERRFRACGAAAILFAIYPAAHENVAWISGRTHLLGLFFALCTAAGVDRSFDVTGRARYVAAACASAAAAAALFSYESAFALPAFVLGALTCSSKSHPGPG